VAKLLDRAAQRHKAGEEAEAERLYRQVLARDACHPAALMSLGALKRGQGRTEEAIRLYERGLARAPDHPGLNQNLGNALLHRQDWPGAERHLRRALAHAATPDVQISLSRALLEQNRPEEAMALCRAALARRPGDARARRNLMLALRLAGREAEAEAELRRLGELAPDDPAIRHLLAAATAQTTATAPPAYVATLFDGFAPHFEQKLQGQLGYRTPELLDGLLRRHLAPGARLGRVLDLGCGTGLMGQLLRPLADRLTGIDLSPRMLDLARAKGIYDDLEVAEITAFLGGGGEPFDLAAAADVLVYVGDLAPLLAGVAARLAPGGCFLFSTEAAPSGFELRRSGRFAHARAYVEAQAATHGFAVVAATTAVIRHDLGQPIEGGLYLLRRGEGPLAQARRLQQAGEPDAAAALLEEVLRERPADWQAMAHLGLVRLQQMQPDVAVLWWRRALEIVPDQPRILRLLGFALVQLHDFAGALAALRRARELGLGDAGMLGALGFALLQEGEAEAALATVREAARLAPDDPEILFQLARMLAFAGEQGEARLALARAREAGLKPAPLGYLEHLIEGREAGPASLDALRDSYDRVAGYYERHVRRGLQNRAAPLLMEILDREAGAGARFGTVLELGCGPGFLGEILRRRAGRLIGVDLSPRMIEEARGRNAYDELAAVDLEGYVAATAERFDLVVAADVLPHVGDLEALLASLGRRCRPGALVLFSTEAGEGQDREPLPEFRFRHSMAYVARAVRAAGFALLAQEVKPIRVEQGRPVPGGLFLLRWPAGGGR
jgi:predicted TPR repeat methyltransferase